MNNTSNSTDTLPWFKQFWPWFLLSVPFISICLGMLMVYFATNGQDALVVDNYYKEGKAINNKLEQIHQAKRLGITTSIIISDQKVTLDVNDDFPGDGSALSLNFYHSTLADRDFNVLLVKEAGNRYVGDITQPINGKWRLTLLPFDQSWKIQQEVSLPRQQAFDFNP